MSSIESTLKNQVVAAVKALYNIDIEADSVQLNTTPKNFQGHYTIVVFPFVKISRKKPEDCAAEIGEYLKANCVEIHDFNVVKGFCNLHLSDAFWLSFMQAAINADDYAQAPSNGQKVVVEYSSPNTNKPLHLGHIRNNLLGYSAAQILKAAGYQVQKVQIINDRGIHICKSMLAWQLWGNGETPESTGMKGDHLIGKYYVKFEQEFQKEYKAWQSSEAGQKQLAEWLAKEKDVAKATKDLEKKDKDLVVNNDVLAAYYFKEVYKNTYFNTYSELGLAAQKMLQDWEADVAEVVDLWKQMNSWVYAGFAITYKNLGVDFDKMYYESET